MFCNEPVFIKINYLPLKKLLDIPYNDSVLWSIKSMSLLLCNPDYNFTKNKMYVTGFLLLLLLFWGIGVYMCIHAVETDFVSNTWTERGLHQHLAIFHLQVMVSLPLCEIEQYSVLLDEFFLLLHCSSGHLEHFKQ